jgi:exonuclease VII small subunit
MQKLQQLTTRIAKLNPAQQAIVEKLVQKLESASAKSALTLDQAIDEFEREHPELLRLLAQ